MQGSWKTACVGLAALVLAAVTGCGSGSGDAPKAAINGPALGPAQGSPAGSPSAAAPKTPPTDPNQFHPKVLIQTTAGDITVELDAAKAPITVDNFLSYVDSRYYEQTIFHQIVKDYVIVAGTYDEQLHERKAGAAIYNEAHNGLKNRRGTLAMARLPDAIHSATSQFFINLHDNGLLDHKDRTMQGYGYCVFGQVVAGMDVVDRIAGTPVHTVGKLEQVPMQAVVIKAVKRL